MNKKNINKGFTLIELLVVIAIIGILSGIIMVNIGDPSQKAKVARIKADMDTIRTTMEKAKIEDTSLQYPTARVSLPAPYTSTTAPSIITKLATDILSNGGTGVHSAHYSSTKYCIPVTMPDTTSWCIDSTGYAGTTSACDGTNFDCK
ncbi:MAG: type II secretion system protein [Candidatus Pacebacteria bacterium]|nr:type II secretion system protein [Candidatus Paceibacterota bacterium]